MVQAWLLPLKIASPAKGEIEAETPDKKPFIE
jgi:hypothetical protein